MSGWNDELLIRFMNKFIEGFLKIYKKEMGY
jgi:hypothetical protein